MQWIRTYLHRVVHSVMSVKASWRFDALVWRFDASKWPYFGREHLIRRIENLNQFRIRHIWSCGRRVGILNCQQISNGSKTLYWIKNYGAQHARDIKRFASLHVCVELPALAYLGSKYMVWMMIAAITQVSWLQVTTLARNRVWIRLIP